MTTPKKTTCRKNEYQKVSFDRKLSIIAEINNGQISANYASKNTVYPEQLLPIG
jgi:hypothetical protein